MAWIFYVSEGQLDDEASDDFLEDQSTTYLGSLLGKYIEIKPLCSGGEIALQELTDTPYSNHGEWTSSGYTLWR